MKKVAIITSGGDAPGMNAAIRSIVRVLLFENCEAWGVSRAYDGLIDGTVSLMDRSDVSNLIHCGGTVLKTARSLRFLTEKGMKSAAQCLKNKKIDTLIAVGGDGTMKGLYDFQNHWDGQVIGIPATIDNDLFGTDETIGYDSALNTAVEAIDKIRDTAGAHERNFIVEVMGKDSGHIAIAVGISGGAEEILIPEKDFSLEQIFENTALFSQQGKSSQIIVVAEKEDGSSGFELAKLLKDRYDLNYKVSVLGHIQRGGSPTARDRILASQLGCFSVKIVKQGLTGVMVGNLRGELVSTPLQTVLQNKKHFDNFLYDLAKILR